MPISGGTISPDEKWLAGLGANNAVQFFNLNTRKSVLRKLPSPRRGLKLTTSLFQWTNDSKKLVVSWYIDSPKNSVTYEIGITIYELNGRVRNFKDEFVMFADEGASQIRFSADKTRIWLVTGANYRAWDIKSGRVIKRGWDLGGRSSSIPYFGALSTDCRTFFHNGDASLQKFDTSTKKELAKPQKLYGLADGDLEFSPDSTLIVHENLSDETENNTPLRMVESSTGRLLWEPAIWPTFSPDSKFCLFFFPDRIEKRDTRTGKLQGKFPPVAKNTHPFQIINDEAFYSVDDKGNLYRSRLK